MGACYLGKIVWPTILEWHDNRKVLWYFGELAYNILLLVVLNIFFAGIYYLELDFIEQYKIIPGPWPWKDKNPKKREKWWGLLNNSVKIVTFNALIIAPAF